MPPPPAAAAAADIGSCWYLVLVLVLAGVPLLLFPLELAFPQQATEVPCCASSSSGMLREAESKPEPEIRGQNQDQGPGLGTELGTWGLGNWENLGDWDWGWDTT